MPRFKCVCAYDGTSFKGWQSQVGGNTVQDFIERRLEKILGIKTRIHASGRTDAGVHAYAQVFHFDADWKHSSNDMLKALRVGFPNSIQISSVKKAPEKFHARYSARKKIYEYNIFEGFAPPHIVRFRYSLGRRKPDIKKMRQAAKLLLGEHDFTAFSANKGLSNDKENPVKTLYSLSVAKSGNEILIRANASGFMYKMMRLICGALLDVGLGKLPPEKLKEILDAKKRVNLFPAAPATGLFLKKVFY